MSAPEPDRPDAAGSSEALEVRKLRAGSVEGSFGISAGECVALRGASGSGKTRLLRAIADIDPSAGAVTPWGEDCRLPAQPGEIS